MTRIDDAILAMRFFSSKDDIGLVDTPGRRRRVLEKERKNRRESGKEKGRERFQRESEGFLEDGNEKLDMRRRSQVRRLSSSVLASLLGYYVGKESG